MRARDVVGRKIIGVNFRRFRASNDPARSASRVWATDPEIVLDNEQRIRFLVQETEVGEYGVELILTDRPAPQKEADDGGR